MKAKKKPARRTTFKIECRLPASVNESLLKLAKLAGVPKETVVKVALAQEVWRYSNAPAPAPAQPVVAKDGEFLTKLGENDKPLPIDAKAWDWVKDSRSGLIWPAQMIEGQFTHSESIAAAKKYGPTCRAPEIWELLPLIKYDRTSPAVDTRFFRWRPDWVWTATKAAAPVGYAWVVGLGYGYSDRFRRDVRYGALAVRVGQ